MKDDPIFVADSIAREAIKTLIGESKKVRLAVAYWGSDAMKLFEKCVSMDVKILCDLDSGACDTNEIRNLIKRFGSKNVLRSPNLHAKVYWTDAGMVLGSSNVSTNGLALDNREAARLREANMLFQAADFGNSQLGKSILSWIEELETMEISERDLEKADAKRRALRSMRGLGYPILDKEEFNWPGSLDDPRLKRVFIIVARNVTDEIVEEWKAKRNEIQKTYGPGMDEGWKLPIPESAYLLEYWIHKDSKKHLKPLVYQGEYLGAYQLDAREDKKSGVRLLREVEDFGGLGLPEPHAIARRIRRLWTSRHPEAKALKKRLLGQEELVPILSFLRVERSVTRDQ